MKKFFILTVLALTMANTAFASDPACDSFTSQVEKTKIALIEQASNSIVSSTVLTSTRASLNDTMNSLNASGLTEDLCPVANLSAEIAQILQAVSDLEHRNTQVVALAEAAY